MLTTASSMTVLGFLMAIGLPLLFIGVRRGDREKIIEHLTKILDLEERVAPGQV